MTIPFLGIFKKATAALRHGSILGIFKKATAALRHGSIRPATASQPRRAAPIEKPSSEKLSKTVLPNKTRVFGAGDHYQKGAAAVPNTKLSSSRAGTKRDLPPAVALALQPKVERAISLQLSHLLEQIPAELLRPLETIDASQRVLLKASEIERGMSSNKPTILLSTVYDQVPDIFLNTVPPDNTTELALPYEKVLEQFQSVHVREDQEVDQDVPQVETPFLKVTIEDTKKFGTVMAPLQTSAHPPVKVEPATAKSLSTAVPEEVARETTAAGAKSRGIRLSSPSTSPASETARVPASEQAGATRIPFNLPPSGTGASATERVPASSGPPVPSPAAKTPTPARVPFKVSPSPESPAELIRPKLTLVPGVEPAKSGAEQEATPPFPAPDAKKEGQKISFALRPIMTALPAFHLIGSAESVPADARIELPLELVTSQLAGGRVAVPAKTFQAALPENHRQLFVIDEMETAVLLPLQEVLKNVPPDALQIRPDQEKAVVAKDTIETPFSIKAAEDAKRFDAPAPVGQKPAETKPAEVKAPAAPAAEKPKEAVIAKDIPLNLKMAEPTPGKRQGAAPSESKGPEPTAAKTGGATPAKPEEKKATSKAKPAKESKTPASPPSVKIEARTPEAKTASPAGEPGVPTLQMGPSGVSLVRSKSQPADQSKSKGGGENDARQIVEKASALPGVAGCAVTFTDGLSLAGNIPAETSVEGLSAMAPSLLQKIDRHMLDTKLGSLTSMTLHGAKSPVTFFMKGSVCLTVLHAGGELSTATQEQLSEMTNELSRTYSETNHVDH